MSHLEQQSFFLYILNLKNRNLTAMSLIRPAGVVRGIGMTQDV
jgi:hypothetical protein